jgi:hypothetical protein
VRALHDFRRMADLFVEAGLLDRADPVEAPTEAEIAEALAQLPKEMFRTDI